MEAETSQQPTTDPQGSSPEFWWPSLSALDDLSVEFEDHEDGSCTMHLAAPDGSECAAWLAYFKQSPEHHTLFERELIQTLLEASQRIVNGKDGTEPVRVSDSDSPREENSAGEVQTD